MSLELISSNKCFGGWHKRYRHFSSSLNCTMQFAIYLPPQASTGSTVPGLYWLSGLTCTDENFMQKAGAQRIAAELGIAIIAPDTSPRGQGVPDAEDGAYDLGLGAGFYVNATHKPWSSHYQMYDYIRYELPALIDSNFPLNQQRAISGHSMGGHGALVLGLRGNDFYRSISAFSPICNPSQTPWGQKALTAYLGSDHSLWKQYDACELLAESQKLPLLVEQGLDDEFLNSELHVDKLEQNAQSCDYPLTLNRHAGYDHSYFFIASFIESHLRFHARFLLESD